MAYPDARLAFAKTGLEPFTLSLNLGSQPDSQRYYNDMSEASLAALKAATGARVFRVNTNLWSYLNDPGFVTATHAFIQACLNVGVTPCIAWQNLYTSRGFDANGGQIYLQLTPADAATGSARLASAFPSSANGNVPYIMLDWNEPNQLGEGGYYESSIIAWGQAIRAADPHAFICCPAPGFSNDITKILRQSVSDGSKNQFELFRDAFAPDIFTEHSYNYRENMRGKIDVRGAFKVWVQEQNFGTFPGEQGNNTPPDASIPLGQNKAYIVACFQQIELCPDVVSVAGWTYSTTADGTPALYMISSRNPTVFSAPGQIQQDIFASYRQYGTAEPPSAPSALASIALPYLNTILQAKNGTSAIREGEDYMAYVPPTSLTLDLSDLTEAQKQRQYWVVTGEGGTGIYGHYGDYNANRYDTAYKFEGSSDGSTWTLAPAATVPAGLSILGNTVSGNNDRMCHHALDLRGFSQVRVTFTGGEGFAGGQVTADFQIYDASSLTTLADWFSIDGFVDFGDSITMLAALYYLGMTDACATPDHPHPVWDWCGSSGIHAYDWLNDPNFDRKMRQPGKFVPLSLGSNDLSNHGAGSLQDFINTLDAMITKIKAVGKVALINSLPHPNGPTTPDGGAPSNVRLAQDDTSVFGMPLRQYMRQRYAGPNAYFLTDLDQLFCDNPTLMRPNDLHPNSFDLYHSQMAADVKALVFGVAPLPVPPVVTPPAPTLLHFNKNMFLLRLKRKG